MKQPSLAHVLQPKWRTALQRLREERANGGTGKLVVLALVDWLRLYLAKLGETLLHSSWMVALMAVPILTAYGVVFKGGVLFGAYAILAIVPMLILPAVLGSAVTLILVNIFPARRTRDLLSIIALGAAGGVILLFRVIRPEQLAPD